LVGTQGSCGKPPCYHQGGPFLWIIAAHYEYLKRAEVELRSYPRSKMVDG